MTTEWQQCEATNGKAKKHYAPVLFQRDTDGLFVCAPCVPPSTWSLYPKPREQRLLALRRLELARQRSTQAKKNFGGTK
jgi:hypothetical protein